MPMVLQTDSDVKDDLDKEQINAPVTMMTTATNNTDDNGGSGSGSAGSVNTIAEEESNENSILPPDVGKCLIVVNSLTRCKGIWRDYSIMV